MGLGLLASLRLQRRPEYDPSVDLVRTHPLRYHGIMDDSQRVRTQDSPET